MPLPFSPKLTRPLSLADQSMMRLLQDGELRRSFARENFFSEMGGASLQAAEAWDALPQETRVEYERRVIAEEREHTSQFSDLPAFDASHVVRWPLFLQG